MSQGYSTRTETPLGIRILCALGVLDAGLTLLKVVGIFGLSIVVGAPLGGPGTVVAAGLAVAQLVVVWGLWELQSWAWTAAIAVIGAGALMDAIGFLTGRGGVVSLVLSGGVLLYVLSKRGLYSDGY